MENSEKGKYLGNVLDFVRGGEFSKEGNLSQGLCSGRGIFGGECLTEMTGDLFGQKEFSGRKFFTRECLEGCAGEMCRVSARIRMQDYKCLHAAVMTCATLVNTRAHTRTHTQTQTDRQRQLLTSNILLVQPAELTVNKCGLVYRPP